MTASGGLEFEAGADAESPERREDIHEILNYRRAMHEAEQRLETLPVSRRVICWAHEVLLDSVRGAGPTVRRFLTVLRTHGVLKQRLR